MTFFPENSRRSILFLSLVVFFTLTGCQQPTETNPAEQLEEEVAEHSDVGQSISDESTPDESTPDESTPDESTPDESTRFTVGSKTFFIHDASRAYDSVAGASQGVRTLITELWYPVAHNSITANSKKATYGDYVFSDKTVHRRMLTETTFFHLTPTSVNTGVSQQQIDDSIDELFHRERGSYVDAALAASSQAWPVIVMTHGDAGSRYNMETAAEYLASHGYIVIAPEHTGNSPFSMSGKDPMLSDMNDSELALKVKENRQYLDELGVYGTAAGFGQSYIPLSGKDAGVNRYVNLDLALVERVNDLRATLTELEKLNQSGMFANRIDLSKIGLMGRSFGGITTLAGLMLEDRFVSGFSVVPPSFPDVREHLPKEILIDTGKDSVFLSVQKSMTTAQLHKPTFLLLGAEDHLILSIYEDMAKSFGLELPSLANPYPQMQNAFETASVPAVYALAENTNHGSFGVSGTYWWPALKPNTFDRYFDKENTYTLLAVERAHQLQKEMALAFFNLTIKEDQSGLAKIKANPWQHDGAKIQISGFE